MKIANDIATIAKNNDMTGLPALDQDVGVSKPVEQLKSFTTLTAADGVYYAKALNTLVITKPGVTFDGYDFSGVSINVTVDNVTFKNSYFDASTGIYAINALPGTKNLTVDHSTFNGLKVDRIGYSDFVTSRGENTTITNSAFLDGPTDAVAIVSGSISGNYFAGGAYATNAHADAIWIGKTIGPVTITDNVIDWRSRADAPTETNNPVRITSESGDVSNVLVKNNIILGGSNTVLVSDGATLTHSADQVGTVKGVRVIENVIDYGKFGDLEQSSRPADMVYADNMHASGLPESAGQDAVGSLPNLNGLNKLVAAVTNSVIYGTDKGDYIIGGSGANSIYGGAGNDVIVGGNGRDFIRGGGGDNIFVYNSLKNSGTDLISDFTQGHDHLYLASLDNAPDTAVEWQWLGTERFTGHDWQIRYSYGSGVTTVQVDADGDLKADFTVQLSGKIDLDQSDFILASLRGNDPAPSSPDSPPTPSTPQTPPTTSTPGTTPTPSEPSIVIQAPANGGRLVGTAADETFVGSNKADDIRGGAGDDIITGKGGKDILYGGAGHDTFVFLQVSDSQGHGAKRDYIGDFTHGEDLIDLHQIDANTAVAGNQSFAWIGSDAFSGSAGELRFKAAHSGGGQVQGDVNGDGIADFAIDVVTGRPLDASDFLL